MKTRSIQFVLTVWLILVSGNSGWSQSSLYFDRDDFLNAALGVTGIHQSISFEFPFAPGPSVTISDVTFTGRYLIRSSIAAGPILYNFDSDVPMGIHFANGALAFGADFSSYTNFTANLFLDNGEVLSFTAAGRPASTFFGFISASPITDLTFSDGGPFQPGSFHEERIGNIFMVMEIPEPRSEALLGLGVGLLLFLSHRKRRRGGTPIIHEESLLSGY